MGRLSAVSSMKCACSMPCWTCGSGASGSACALAASSFNLKHVSPTQCHANRLFAFDSVSQKSSRTSSPPPPTNVMRVNLPFSSTEGSTGQSLESKGLNKFRRGFECTRTNKRTVSSPTGPRNWLQFCCLHLGSSMLASHVS